jgi:hypothetical protein
MAGRDRRTNSVAWTQGERFASAAGDRWLQRASLSLWTDRRAQSQTGRVRAAVLIAVFALIAATGVVIAEDLFWVDQAEQARGLMDGE